MEFVVAVSSYGDGYVDISVTPPSTAPYSFTFGYKRPGDLKYFYDADISCAEAVSVSGSVVSVDSGACIVRWMMSSNGISKTDGASVSVTPSSSISVSYNVDDVSTIVDITGAGVRSATSSPSRKFGDRISVMGNTLYWDGQPVYASASGIKYAMTAKVALVDRIFIVESNDAITDITSAGVVTYTYSLPMTTPVFLDYDPVTGNLAVAYSTNEFARILEWLDPLDGTMKPSPGTIVYSTTPTTMGTLRSCAFTTSTRICVTGSLGIGIYETSSGSPLSTLSEVEYSSSQYSVVAHTMTVDAFWAKECGEGGPITVARRGRPPLSYDPDRAVHKTFTRSLGPDSSGQHPSLSNCIFRPVPVRNPMQVGIVNSEDLKKRTEEDSRILGSSFVAAYGRYPARGRMGRDLPVVGVSQGRVHGTELQTFVAMTGQKLTFSNAIPPVSYGYSVSENTISPVRVETSVSVYIRDIFTGTRTLVGTLGDSNLEYRLPEASAGSYARYLAYQVHGAYSVEFEMTEARDGSEYTSTSSVLVVALWWRQVLKEGVSELSPVSSYSFPLEDYAETPQDFFDNWTVFPSFYATVGGQPVAISDEQKEILLFESSIGLLSFALPVCPGDSPASEFIGLKPAAVTELPGVQRKSPMYGMLAAFQASNLFQDRDASLSSSQALWDAPSVMFVGADGVLLPTPAGGLVPIPAYGDFLYASSVVSGENYVLVLAPDAPSFTVENVAFYDGETKTRAPKNKDTDFIVSFECSDNPTIVTMSVSVDGGPWISYTDVSGAMREYRFQSSSMLLESSVIKFRLWLYDATGEKSEYVSRFSVAEAWGGISLSNVRIYDDRDAKVIRIVYDLDSAYDYLPVNVTMTLTVEGETMTGFTGDIGLVYAGAARTATFSYYPFVRSQLYARSVVSISATSVVTVLGTGDFPFYLRGSKWFERPFSVSAFATPVPAGGAFGRANPEAHPVWNDSGSVKDISVPQTSILAISTPLP